MEPVTAWIIANPTLAAGIVVGAASFIAELTPSKKDDAVVKKYSKAVVNFLALNWVSVLKIVKSKG